MAEQMGTLISGAFPSRIDQGRKAQATAPILDSTMAAKGWRCLMSAAGESGQSAVEGECRL